MLKQLLRKSVQAYTEKIALVYGDMRLSYQELYYQITGLRQGLQTHGIQDGSSVALLLSNCPEFIISFYAIALLDATAIPLNPSFKEEELRYYLDESEATCIVTDHKRLPLCSKIVAQSTRKIDIIVVDKITPGTHYFYDLIRPHDTHSSQEDPSKDHSEGYVLYQYSSGSTGKPKRVRKTHAHLASEADNFNATVNITSDDCILCLIPLFHTYGFGNCVLAPIRAGATLVMLEPAVLNDTVVEIPLSSRVEHILGLIRNERVSIVPAVPYIYKMLVDTPIKAKPDLSSLRLCLSAGNFLPREVFDKFLQIYGIAIRQQYGCTEAGAITVNLENTVDPIVAGKPLLNTEIQIIDENNNFLVEGIGEIIVRSPSLIREYYKQPELNAIAFQNGYYCTGDLGKLDDEGRLYITGRKKIFIDTGGYKVDPIEIEEVLLQHPQVLEVAVVGVMGEQSEIIKAVIVSNGFCSRSDIIVYCKTRLADFKIPRIVEFRSELPRSPLGKLLRKDLLDPVSENETVTSSILTSLSAMHTSEQRGKWLEMYLEDLLNELLELNGEQIDPQRAIGEYGLNSVSMLEFLSRLESGLSISFSPTLIWSYPTIKGLANYLCAILTK